MSYNDLDFDKAMNLLEEKLDELEKIENIEKSKPLYDEAIELKKYCESLLTKEREEIKALAKESGISLDELGLDDDDDSEDNDTYLNDEDLEFFDEKGEEGEEEDEDSDNKTKKQ
ncbi:MAG: hypothetical protein LBT02_04125 [Rickettsiales bacterium]|jgi:exonuclease VII small subunit|nr:hypothetical protein [Rickettsiales bacterium]